MKQIISATILSLAFLLGTVFHEWANRYEYFHNNSLFVTRCDTWTQVCVNYKSVEESDASLARYFRWERHPVNEVAALLGVGWHWSLSTEPTKTVEDILGPRPEKEE